MSTGKTPENPIVERITGAFVNYLDEAQKLAITSGVLLGRQDQPPKAFVWNLLNEDFHPSQSADPRFYTLGQLEWELKKGARELPLRISNVGPSQLIDLKTRCAKERIMLEEIRFNPSNTTNT